MIGHALHTLFAASALLAGHTLFTTIRDAAPRWRELRRQYREL